MTIYKMRFPHGIHIGAVGIGTEKVRISIPSDTLFSALLSAWIGLGNDPAPWVEQFPRTDGKGHIPADPPFLLTSAFPYKGSTLFLPKPLVTSYAQGVPEKFRKKWKRALFVSEALLLKLAKGAPIAELIGEGDFLQKGLVFRHRAEKGEVPEGEEIWNAHTIPRVTL
ncbi:TPA: hypothetical protein EYP13_04320, partial [Candidatus Micrarchaeota archaeon]|nr:hypothetical protein [Candidatus Micrarchaeota archaeon]